MNSQLLAYIDAHRQSQTEAHRITDDLSEDQFNWKPDESAWSVAECFAHLNIVAEAYLPLLETAVTEGARKGEGPFEYGFMSRKAIDGVRPDGPALKTSVALDPSKSNARSAFDKAQTLETLDDYVSRYVAVCEQAEGLDLARIKVRYPFMRLFRFPLGVLLEITGLHALRHIQQAERVTQQPEFPS